MKKNVISLIGLLIVTLGIVVVAQATKPPTPVFTTTASSATMAPTPPPTVAPQASPTPIKNTAVVKVPTPYPTPIATSVPICDSAQEIHDLQALQNTIGIFLSEQQTALDQANAPYIANGTYDSSFRSSADAPIYTYYKGEAQQAIDVTNTALTNIHCPAYNYVWPTP